MRKTSLATVGVVLLFCSLYLEWNHTNTWASFPLLVIAILFFIGATGETGDKNIHEEAGVCLGPEK